MRNQTTTWQRTKTPGLLRHRNGTFYSRFHIGGKEEFKTLDTHVPEVAKIRFAERKLDVERRRKAARNTEAGIATMGDLLEMYIAAVKRRVGIKERTRELHLGSAAYITKTWPGDFRSLRVQEITPSAMEAWKNHALTNGTGFRPKGAKETTPTSGRSASSFNKAVDAVRRMLDVAVEKGAIHTNVISGRRGIKAPDVPRKPKLPESDTIKAIFEEMARIGGRGIEAADFCRGIALTGCRQKEAAGLTWGDVDFKAGVVHVNGTKTADAVRDVPLIPAARELFEKLLEKRKANAETAIDGVPHVPSDARVFRVSEASKSLARACAVVGAPKLGHHDLRDAFATLCIESGVLIPTVAAWLGHKDGGALLLRVYNHHRPKHSMAEAAKVNF